MIVLLECVARQMIIMIILLIVTRYINGLEASEL